MKKLGRLLIPSDRYLADSELQKLKGGAWCRILDTQLNICMEFGCDYGTETCCEVCTDVAWDLFGEGHFCDCF